MVLNVSLQHRVRASDFEGMGSNTFLFLPAWSDSLLNVLAGLNLTLVK